MSGGRRKRLRRYSLDIWFAILPAWAALLYWTIFSPVLEGLPTSFTPLHFVGLLAVGLTIMGCMIAVEKQHRGLNKAIWWGTVVFLFPFGCTLCYFTSLRQGPAEEVARPLATPALPVSLQKRLGGLMSAGKWFLVTWNIIIVSIVALGLYAGTRETTTVRTTNEFLRTVDSMESVLLGFFALLFAALGIFSLLALRLLRLVYPDKGRLWRYCKLTLILCPVVGLSYYSRLSRQAERLRKTSSLEGT